MVGLFALLILFAMSTAGGMPTFLMMVYSAVSAITFVLYGLDKLFAIKGWGRISEKTLHLYALMGGWPGSNIAQEVFKHKTSKSNFRRTYYLTVVVNIVLLIGFLKIRMYL